MDMEVDIPLPEELEWLEANSHLQDDFEEDLEPPDFYPEEEEKVDQPKNQPQQQQQQQQQQPLYLPKPPLSIPSKPSLSIPGKPSLESLPKPPPFASSPSPPDPPQINGQKRPRSGHGPDAPSSAVATPSEKRTRSNELPRAEIDDEDWLRYSPPPRETVPEAEEPPVKDEKILSRFASDIDGDFIPVTAPGGDRVYAKISWVEREGVGKKSDANARSGGLMSESIDDLLQKVERDSFMKALEASSEGNGDVNLPETSALNAQLWVDKYAPNSFTELLSDEQTNREVLLWLKKWDSCVFGSEIRSTANEVLTALRRHSSIAQQKKLCDTGFSRRNSGLRFDKESFQRSGQINRENCSSEGVQEFWNKSSRVSGQPEQKVLLLCGPPGLGKTTLAHIAAKHCGYHVVEINASDDRSASTIESKILDVVQMNSVMADSKPKCLVIDEIDGALGDGKGAVEVILKMVSSERKSDDEKANLTMGEKSGSTSSKKRRKIASLSRPVICICNDLYAPALRPLRQIAKVHIFSQPSISRVVSRLKYILHKEGLNVSSIALAALADYTECDIRSCLNTLQFLNKKNESLNVMDISSQVVGRKDMSRSAFDVWKGIFQKRTKKQQRKSDNCCSSSPSTSGIDFLHSLITNCGEYDLVFDGIHENILQLHYLDPVMQKTVNCLDNLGVSDLIHRYIMRTQQMSLMVYQPTIAIIIHSLIARAEKSIIEWPKSFQRCRTISMEKMESLRSWHSKIKPEISRHLSLRSFVEDLVSPLLHILSPPALRPVALHLLSEKENQTLAQLVSMMVSYSITYKNKKCDPFPSNQTNAAAGDSLMLSFEPPISDFIHFKGYKSGHFVLASAMKQIVVHEVEKQRILLQNISRHMHPKQECDLGKENGRVSSAKTDDIAAHANCIESLKQKASNLSSLTKSTDLDPNRDATTTSRLKSFADVKKPRNGFNFFDRFKKLGSKGSQIAEIAMQDPNKSERTSHSVLFKFNEGFTNAVKRPVRIRDFLQ